MSLDLTRLLQLEVILMRNPPLYIVMLFSFFLYFSLKRYQPDSVPMMSFVDSWRSAPGIFRLFSSSLLCWQAATYCTVRVEMERWESVAAPWLWFVIVKVWDELWAGSIFPLFAAKTVDEFTWFPNRQKLSFWKFSLLLTSKALCCGAFVLRPLLCRCTLWWQFCWVFLN